MKLDDKECGQVSESLRVSLDAQNDALRRAYNSELRYKTLLDQAADALFVFNMDGRFVEVNRQACTSLGYSSAELLQMGISDIAPEYDLSGRRAAWENFEIGKRYCVTAMHRRKDGSTFPVDIHLAVMMVDGERLMMALASDITERNKYECEIHNLAFYDSLTQLPNRRLLNDRLLQAMAASNRSGHYCAMLFLDLDNFKPINDQYGHSAGDLLLVEAARRINKVVREVDTVARFGGDEFVVILNGLDSDKEASAKQAAAVAEKIRLALDVPYLLKIKHEDMDEMSIAHHCSSSIGVMLFSKNDSNAEDIVRWADIAMYQAKSAGRNQIKFYEGRPE